MGSPCLVNVNKTFMLTHNVNEIFTVRNSRCGKVMFSQASVILSMEGCTTCSRGGGIPACTETNILGRHPQSRHPRADTPLRQILLPPRRPLQRMVRILLECILVFACFLTNTITKYGPSYDLLTRDASSHGELLHFYVHSRKHRLLQPSLLP